MDHLDGTLFVDRLRGIKRDLIVRKIQKLTQPANGNASSARRVLRHAGVRRADARARCSRSRASGRRRRHAARSSARPRPAAAADARQGARARRAASPCCSPDRLKDAAFLRAVRALAPDLGVVAAYGQHPARRAARDPAARHDQRARVAAAALSRRGAGPSRRASPATRETGVTIMRVVKELDAGPMLAVSDASRSRRTRRATSRARPREVGAALLIQVVDRPVARPRRGETPQDDARRHVRAQADQGRRRRSTGADRPQSFTTWCAACIRGRTRPRHLDGRRVRHAAYRRRCRHEPTQRRPAP